MVEVSPNCNLSADDSRDGLGTIRPTLSEIRRIPLTNYGRMASLWCSDSGILDVLGSILKTGNTTALNSSERTLSNICLTGLAGMV